MFGQMMDRPLLISAILRHAELQHPNREIVSITADHPRHRYTFREAFARSRKLANALQRLGLKQGDRLATLAWNDFRHFEIYYGVSCSGFVCHTINPRLFEDQIVYIANHAEDRWLFLDPAFVPVLEKLQSRLPKLEGYVILTDDAHMPATSLPRARSYESLIASESDQFEWPEFDERTASSLCYTSGTTGDPKGVLYSHRSTLLHTYAAALPDAMGLAGSDVVLPVVPMFHVNAWALPYGCAMVGAKLVFPGPKMGDPETLQALIESEQVTFAAGVPTVWQGLIAYLEKSGKNIDSLQRVLCGGSAVPLSMMNQLRERGVEVMQAWGMTEMSPIGTICPLGYMQITDRTKDVIKSGGEWISSIELENLAVAHPAVAQAAAIAIPHSKWQERPLLVVVLKPGASATREELLGFYLGKIAKWWIPDDVVFVDKLPLTATGKLSKLQLRQQFVDYRLPTD